METIEKSFVGGIIKIESYATPNNEKIDFKDRAKNFNEPLKFKIFITSKEDALSTYRDKRYFLQFSYTFAMLYNLVTKEFSPKYVADSWYFSDKFGLNDYRVCLNKWEIRSNATEKCKDFFREEMWNVINEFYNKDFALLDTNKYLQDVINRLESDKKEQENKLVEINNLLAQAQVI